MLLKKNEEMDYIPVDENCVVLFDADRNETHFFEGTAADIVRRIYSEEISLETMIGELEDEYDDPLGTMRQDVKELLCQLERMKAVFLL